MKFSDIIGQESLKKNLQKAVRTKTPAQAYIIEGEMLSGKKMLANTFAQALLCEKGSEEPCGQCHACKMAEGGSHPDIIHITRGNEKNYKVANIRKDLAGDVTIRPYYGPYKVYIVEEAEKLNLACQNALLKTLEDPPGYAVILLLTTVVSSFLPTVRSRCIHFGMAPVRDDIMIDQLTSRYKLPMYDARTVCSFAQGNFGKAQSLAASHKFVEMRKTTVQLLSYLDSQPLDLVLSDAQSLAKDYQSDLSQLFDFFVIWYRDVIVYKALEDRTLLINQDESYAIAQMARKTSYKELKEIFAAIRHARELITRNIKGANVMEGLLLGLKER